MLSVRLINQKTLDDKTEIMMINELKEECGEFYT